MNARAAIDGATVVLLFVLAGVMAYNHWPAGSLRSGRAYDMQQPAGAPDRTPSGQLLDPAFLHDSRSMSSHVSNPDATVRVIVFEDFTCSWCAKLDSSIRVLQRRFPDVLSIAYRELLLDSTAVHARDTHIAARCAAQQGAFDAYHRAVFDNQSLAGHPGGWRRIARRAAVPDFTALEECVEHQVYLPEIMRSTRAAHSMGYPSTPILFVGQRQYIGAAELPVLLSLIEAAIVDTRQH